MCVVSTSVRLLEPKNKALIPSVQEQIPAIKMHFYVQYDIRTTCTTMAPIEKYTLLKLI